MYYVYIIKSINFPNQFYTGCTQDLDKRLLNHNSGVSPYTAKFKPWKIVSYVVFEDRTKAYEFEIFLKSGSGREFRNKRLI